MYVACGCDGPHNTRFDCRNTVRRMERIFTPMTGIGQSVKELDSVIEALETLTGVPAIDVVPAKQTKQPKEAKKQKQPKAEEPAKPEDPLTQSFAKCDIRVSEIKTCERVDFSEKLLLMTLDIGGETRTFAAGIAAFYAPEDLVGKRICTIVNLPHRPMAEKRITSQAMLFAGGFEKDGERILRVCFPDQGVALGTRVVPEDEPDIPAAGGYPKKHFDKVLTVLRAQDGCMTLDGRFLSAGGCRVKVDVPDGTSLG